MNPESQIRYLSLFSMPNPVRITGRSSSITNSFVNGVIPVIKPLEDEVRAVLEVLGMGLEICCSYCGDVSTEWDHLNPLVVAQRPTGYISEIHNLVPACGKCNQSKGNKPWKVWMLSDARLSPKTRGVVDLAQRIQRLEAYEGWANPTRMDFETVVSSELWQSYWNNHQNLLAAMRESEAIAVQVRAEIARAAHAPSLRLRGR